MTTWTDQQILAIARRVLVDETSSDERKAWAAEVLKSAEQDANARAIWQEKAA